MSTKWQRFTVELPPEYKPAEREAIGEEIIAFIQKRTEKGLSWRNTRLAGYSKAYTESLNFKIAGKSKNHVDLTQSGDMLGDMTVLKTSKGKIIIGFENGTLSNAIADGNIRGTYGHSSTIGPKRNFLGITRKDLMDEVLSKFPIDETTPAETKGNKAPAAQDSGSDEGDDG
jgi:hypothetical protein